MIGILYGAAGFAAALCLFLAGYIFGQSVPESRRTEEPESRRTEEPENRRTEEPESQRTEEEKRKEKELTEAFRQIITYSPEVAYKNGK